MYSNGIRSYRRTNVTTADPKKLVLMCYEAASNNLKIGREKIIENDYEGKAKAFMKAQDIINELLCSLDFEKGGVIAKSLDSLYNYMLRRLISADLEKDTSAVDEVIGILDQLKSAWEEAFYKQNKKMHQEAKSVAKEKRQQAVGYMSL